MLLVGHGDDSAVDIADPDMETIDLSDKVSLDESCIIVDNALHYAASSKPRKFRSYKVLLALSLSPGGVEWVLVFL
jgi:hypothetical protein